MEGIKGNMSGRMGKPLVNGRSRKKWVILGRNVQNSLTSHEWAQETTFAFFLLGGVRGWTVVGPTVIFTTSERLWHGGIGLGPHPAQLQTLYVRKVFQKCQKHFFLYNKSIETVLDFHRSVEEKDLTPGPHIHLARLSSFRRAGRGCFQMTI